MPDDSLASELVRIFVFLNGIFVAHRRRFLVVHGTETFGRKVEHREIFKLRTVNKILFTLQTFRTGVQPQSGGVVRCRPRY